MLLISVNQSSHVPWLASSLYNILFSLRSSDFEVELEVADENDVVEFIVVGSECMSAKIRVSTAQGKLKYFPAGKTHENLKFGKNTGNFYACIPNL